MTTFTDKRLQDRCKDKDGWMVISKHRYIERGSDYALLLLIIASSFFLLFMTTFTDKQAPGPLQISGRLDGYIETQIY